jgi:hypothetical protein
MVFDGCLVDRNSGFRHQVYGLFRREQWEPFQSHISKHFANGLLDPLFKFADGLLGHVHRS